MSTIDKLIDLMNSSQWQTPTWRAFSVPVKITAETRYSIVNDKDGHRLKVAAVSEEREISSSTYTLPALETHIATLISWRDKLAKLEGKE